MKKQVSLLTIGIFLWLAFSVLNLATSWLFADKKIDMTINKRYTLSAQTHELVKGLNEPVNVRLYISDNLGKYDIEMANYADYVSGLLLKYQELDTNKIKFEIRKISLYSEMERIAVRDGMIPVVVEDENTYLGISISTTKGKTKSIPYINMARSSYLETDINRIMYNLFDDKEIYVGITSQNIPLFNLSKKEKNWSILPVLQENYTIVEVPDNRSYIPLDMDVLILLNPGQLPEQYLYALDQYLLYGGKLIVFVDPYSEIQHFYQGYPPVNKTNINKLIENFGIRYDANIAVGDIANAEKVNIETNGIVQSKYYPLWTFVSDNDFSALHFRTPGAIELKNKDDLNIVPLIVTSKQGGEVASGDIRYNPKSRIMNLYKQVDKEYVLAAKATGEFVSNFIQGIFDGTDIQDEIPPFLPISMNNKGELVVIADSDFVADDTWVLKSKKQNPIYGTIPYASNADYIINLIDSMVGRNDLIKYGNLSVVSEKSNIAKNIFEKLHDRYSSQENEIERKEIKTSEALVDVMAKAKYADHGEMLEYRKQIDAKEKEISEYKAELQYINYAKNKEADDKINMLIIINLLLAPVSILLLIFALITIMRRTNVSKWKK